MTKLSKDGASFKTIEIYAMFEDTRMNLVNPVSFACTDKSCANFLLGYFTFPEMLRIPFF
jgi:hypothetical protein